MNKLTQQIHRFEQKVNRLTTALKDKECLISIFPIRR